MNRLAFWLKRMSKKNCSSQVLILCFEAWEKEMWCLIHVAFFKRKKKRWKREWEVGRKRDRHGKAGCHPLLLVWVVVFTHFLTRCLTGSNLYAMYSSSNFYHHLYAQTHCHRGPFLACHVKGGRKKNILILFFFTLRNSFSLSSTWYTPINFD